MKKILIIDCHPNAESFCTSLSTAYKKGAAASGAEIQEIVIRDLKFNPNLQYGYQKRTELEPDLLDAWEKIKWAEHMVWVHPVWWGGLPAIAKGFLDRLFLPGFVFSNIEGSFRWEKHLKGKSAHILLTLDQPSWTYSLIFGKPSVNQLKKAVLGYCGVKPIRVSYFGPVRMAKKATFENWLKKAEKSGNQLL